MVLASAAAVDNEVVEEEEWGMVLHRNVIVNAKVIIL